VNERPLFHCGTVAVIGRPNSGKSTLVNRLVGRKVAIVSDKPQTTRRRILGIVHRPEGQVVLLDTPGIHRPEHRMNAAMVRDAEEALSGCDLALFLLDAAVPRGPGERFILERIRAAGAPAVLALNKIDRTAKPRLLPLMAELSSRFDFRDIVPISARTGDGVEELLGALLRGLPEGPPVFPPDVVTTESETGWMAEIVREKILLLTRDELPFSTAVKPESIRRDREKDLTVFSASIFVERESQKAIVVGKHGGMIRRVGEAARRELEQFLGGRVFVDLVVKVHERWREDDLFLTGIVNPELK
jgi:GTPase